MQNGWFYDGRSALRRQVEVGVDGDQLRITGEGVEHGDIPIAELVFLETRDDVLIYGREPVDGWRLGLARPLTPPLQACMPAPKHYGRWIDRFGLWRASIVGAALSAMVVLFVYKLPHWIAPVIPEGWINAYGEALVGDFGGKFCADKAGQAALDKLTRQLVPDASKFNIRVVNIPVVNAAALPGGNIVIFRKLLAEADSAEEVAGILGHEIAHVQHHDVAETMIRELGLGLVVTALGGDIGGNIHKFLSLGYGRDAERAADTAAIALLNRAGISPAPTAGFFERLAKTEKQLGQVGDMLAYVSTHPISANRAQKFRDGADPGKAYAPALSASEWRSLVNICHQAPAQKFAPARARADTGKHDDN